MTDAAYRVCLTYVSYDYHYDVMDVAYKNFTCWLV